MKRLSRPRLLISLVTFLLTGCVLSFALIFRWRYQQRELQNVTLIQALRAGDTHKANVALNVDADSNAYVDTRTFKPLPTITYWQYGMPHLRGETPGDSRFHAPVLSLAISWGHQEIVEMLLARGANVDAPDGMGSTPLLYAADHNALAILMSLLDHHADVNHKNRAGNTALHLALLQKNLADCQLLIDRGADVNAVNGEGQAPLDLVAGMAAEIHRQWLGQYAQALAEQTVKPRATSRPNANTMLPLPQNPPPPLITRHFQHQLDLLTPFLTLLQKHGAAPSAATQRLLTDSFLLDPHEAEEGLAPPKTP